MLLSFFSASAQVTVIGLVTDSNHTPIFGCNIALLNQADRQMIKGTSSLANGQYSFAQLNPGNYIIRFTAMGTAEIAVPLSIPNGQGDTITLPPTILKFKTEYLKNVEVLGRKNLYEQKIDRLVVNVASNSIHSGGTALDVLQRSPGIMLDVQTNTLSLMGKDGVLVYLDGKPTYLAPSDLTAMLRGMPADNIEKIEIITNPSARYDAAGNSGIINIVRKKSNTEGTNGQATAALGTGQYLRHRAGVQFNHKQKQWATVASYNWVGGGDYWKFTKLGFQVDPSPLQPDRENFNNISTRLRTANRTHSAKLAADYEINRRSSVGIVYNLVSDSRQEEGPTYSSFQRALQLPFYFKTATQKELRNKATSHLLNFNYAIRLQKNEGMLSIDADYGQFHRDFYNYLNTSALLSLEKPAPAPFGFLNKMPTQISIHSGKADYTAKMAKNVKMESGVKYISVTTKNYLTVYEGPSGQELYEPSLDNEFNYTEQVYAGYTNFLGRLGPKTEFQSGLRFEYTLSNANSVTLKDERKREYGKLFPSVYVKHNLKKQQTISFSYSYRVDRPDYQDMNPGRSYIDPYSYKVGSPYLLPQYTHAFDLRYGVQKNFFAGFGANIIQGNMQFVNHYTEGNKFYRIKENVGNAQMLTVTTGYTENIKPTWQLQTSLLVYYNLLQLPFEQRFYRFRNLAARLNLAQTWRLKNGWSMDASGWVNTPKRRLLGIHGWEGSLDIGVQKLVNDQWRIKCSAQDLLHTIGTRSLSNLPEFYQDVKVKTDTRLIMLTVVYSFGNTNLKALKQRKTTLDEEARRASAN